MRLKDYDERDGKRVWSLPDNIEDKLNRLLPTQYHKIIIISLFGFAFTSGFALALWNPFNSPRPMPTVFWIPLIGAIGLMFVQGALAVVRLEQIGWI